MTQDKNKTSPIVIFMLIVLLAAYVVAGYMFYEMKNITEMIMGDKK